LTEDIVTQDLGRKADQYQMEIFFLGDNYFLQRDNFLRAAASAEPGILIHPYLGTREVYIQSYSLNENSDDGRMATISVTFVEAGTSKFSQISQDQNFNLLNTAGELENVSRSNFILDVITNQVPEYTRQVIGTVSNPIFSRILQQINLGNFVGSVLAEVTNSRLYQTTYATLRANLDTLINPTASLLANTQGFADLVISTFGQVNEVGSDGKSANKILKEAQGGTYTSVIEYTPAAQAQNTNAEATIRFINLAGIANQAKSLPNMTFESRQEALAIRDVLVSDINNLIETSQEDSEYNALKSLKAEVMAYLPPTNIDLPELKTYTTKATTSSLVLAYRLYANTDLESDLVARNKIRHPGFIDPNQNLEVLIGA
jgi:prophage DNA circulation protein